MNWQNDQDDLSLLNIERDREWERQQRYHGAEDFARLAGVEFKPLAGFGPLFVSEPRKYPKIDWDAVDARLRIEADRMRRERVYMGWDTKGVWNT